MRVISAPVFRQFRFRLLLPGRFIAGQFRDQGLDFDLFRLLLRPFLFSVAGRAGRRRSVARGLEGHPAQALKGYFRPLVGLVGVDHLVPGHRRDCPAGNHPCRKTQEAGENHEGAAEVAAGPLTAHEEEPVHGVVPSRGKTAARRIGQPVGILRL